MNDEAALETMVVLREFGFVPKSYPPDGGLMYCFANCDLVAYDESTWKIDFVGSIEGTRRVIHPPIEFHFSRFVISKQQCAALLCYYLRHYPIQQPPLWLIEGQQWQDLLPWKLKAAQDQAAFDALPKCRVGRDWMKLALKELAARIGAASYDGTVVFDFANGVLSIGYRESKIVAPGDGFNWPRPVEIPAGEFRNLPKRLMKQEVLVVVRESYLSIDTMRYKSSPAEAS